MIKLTLYDSGGSRSPAIWIRATSIISMVDANPKGTLIACEKGNYHVNQTVDQIFAAMDKA